MNESENKLYQVRDWIEDPFWDVALTDREREVITLASHGVSAIKIARLIGTKRQAVYEVIWRTLRKISPDCQLEIGDLVEYTIKRLERIVS